MDDMFVKLGVGLMIGLLVGLERGWRERDAPAGSRTAGFRTYGIFGLLGGIFAALSLSMEAPVLLVAGFIGFAAAFGAFQYNECRHDGNFSITGLMAGYAVFGLGAMAALGETHLAAAAGAVLAAILASREVLHALLRKMKWVELRSTLMLVVMTAVILPLLPDRALDPWGGFNPWEIWFFTVLIGAISYAGYIAVRVFGPERGFTIGALAGALVSSTAVTVAVARLARGQAHAACFVGAAALAAMVSVLRVVFVTGLLRADLLPLMGPAALAAAALFGVAGVALLRGAKVDFEASTLRNPFDLRALLIFAALFAAVSTLSAVAVDAFGAASLAATSAVSGMFDVDVAVLSALRMADGGVPQALVAGAILIALASNAFGRVFLSVLAGPVKFWGLLLVVTLLAAAAGGGVFALVSWGAA